MKKILSLIIVNFILMAFSIDNSGNFLNELTISMEILVLILFGLVLKDYKMQWVK